jgi:3-oxoacyl-[acyl-carrier protein] reductase
VLAVRADAADEADADAAVARTVERFGGLDVLVANAGVATMAPIEAFATADFDRTFAVNVRGVFLAVRAAARSMRDGGRIVAIGSVNGESMPFAGGSVYAASKGAVALLMQGVARDLGPRGITANTVQPGPVDTDMNPAQGPFADMLRSRMALPRYGRGEEIAAMVAWLAGPEAGFVTGARLTVDGGFEA